LRISPQGIQRALVVALLAATLSAPPVSFADSSSPRLAGYYDLFMAICGTQVYEWQDNDAPREVFSEGLEVGVGRTLRYLLTNEGELKAWKDDPAQATHILGKVKSFHAGHSGLFIIRNDNGLWYLSTERLLGFGEGVDGEPARIARDVLNGAIGDSANYFVTRKGTLFVKGLAHRG
jgi:hypothetical protein